MSAEYREASPYTPETVGADLALKNPNGIQSAATISSGSHNPVKDQNGNPVGGGIQSAATISSGSYNPVKDQNGNPVEGGIQANLSSGSSPSFG